MDITGENTPQLNASSSKINPSEFDVTITALLIGLGAEKYIDIFRKQNIGQCTLAELCDEDLIKLGVDDSEIRQKILDEVQNLPMYEESIDEVRSIHNLGLREIGEVLEENGQHLYKIHLSMVANNLALKRTKNISDCLLMKDKYASEIALTTLQEMKSILNSMDKAIHSQLKAYAEEPRSKKNKKIIVGTVGGVMIALLGVLFVRSLKQLK
ncbi:uncharacterized protein LOC105382007 [Plutella xylostella]|uniref:uncharacterized protein LOC105382007 n=1 Tax=Plutella xylostella TaxID=51655 RepID=UPI002032CA16|nr:uncharacterized protein LOC105382007 [Plutella xylostella]